VKTSRAGLIIDYLRKAAAPDGAGLPDGQLLRLYAARRDEAAFAVLVRRHGPMVLGVCRRTLRHAQDAEDAFQATFVVLARKAGQVAHRPVVGAWLHGVAHRAALDVRRRVARRRAKEQQVENMPHPLVTAEEDHSELLAALDRELARLPEKYRLPVVLCELEGRSRKEAAFQLGCPEGTLSSRLGRARKTLARRMAANGPAVTGASLAALFTSEAGAAVVPGPLVASTVKAAGGVVSAGVVALAEGVLKAMLLTKIKSAALALLLAASLGAGAVTFTYRATAAEQRQTKTDTPPTATRSVNPDRDDLEALRLEVEALRAGLQATRERVKGLEAEVHALKAAESVGSTYRKADAADPNNRTAAEAAASFYSRIAAAHLALPAASPTPIKTERAPQAAPATVTPPPLTVPAVPPPAITPPATTSGSSAAVEISPSGGKAGNEVKAKVKNAAARLMTDPTNKEAQDALKRALEELNGDDLPKGTGN
jgi:RNA polymerase sigma factor (sigma-70 family)